MIPITIQYQLSTEQLDELNLQFKVLCQELSPKINNTELFQNITTLYAEGQRAYHNLSHIHSMLYLTQEFNDLIEQPDMLQLAIWYHDIIYDPARKDNELKSAKYAKDVLSTYLDESMLTALQALINSTAKHQPLIPHPVNHWLLDLDLAVLASNRSTYEAYKAAIRQEYIMYPKFLYRPGRKKVLKQFLERDQIYFTELFQTRYETIARDNLEWELSTL